MSGIHLSQEELSEKIKSHFHWRSIDADVTTTIEICDQCIPSTINIPGDTVWKKVEITVHGPFDSAASESKYVIMIRDTYSNFVNAEIVDNDAKENVVKSAANYVFSTLCQFGFTSCVYVSQSRNLYEAFVTQIDALLASLDDVPLKARAMVKFAHQPSGQGNRLAQQLQEFAEVENWPYKFDAWLFKMRTSMQDCLIPPFSVMFSSRDPIAINHGVVSGSVNDVVSFASKPSARRVLKKSMLICRHCEEAFTSRISFRLHQKHHLEDARNRGVIEGEEVDGGAKKKRRMKKFSTTSSVTLTTTTAKKLSTSPVIVTATVTNAQELTESTVSAVKALLAATKDDRLKRGKYFKYSKELKEEIAAYAMEHGNLAAANHYTTKLNNPLAESSVRNFVKYYSRKLSEALREEIGKFAYHFGTDECINVYKGKESLTKTEVKRLRSEYVEKHPDATTVGNIGGVDVNDESIKKQKLIFEESLRNEIGHYAFLCSNSKAVQYFTDKLQLPVKESTVRKFKLAWMAKNNVEQVTSIPAQHRDQADDVVLVNDGPDFELLDQSYMEQQQQQILKIEQVDFEIVEPGPSSAQSAAQPIPLTVKETKKAGPASEPRKAVKKLKTLKKKERLKRGNYANYDPSLRAEIAKFSLTHTNQETVLHFKKRLGVQLPESTVRGLRAKLQRRIDNDTNVDDIDDVSELDHFQRGRPMRLGAYDSVVRDCIEKLIQTSGEKVSSFMVIATAKQVLMQHDPGLLHENGGYIKLNPTWAKSFLKRLGVRSKD